MIQPPGASDWIYAAEVPQLKDALGADLDDDEDDEIAAARRRQMSTVFAGVFAVVVVLFGGAALYLSQQLPRGTEVLIGEGGLSYADMIVTESTVLLSEADERAASKQSVKKDEVLTLLAKRGDFYRARTLAGAEGWIRETQVIPMYQLGGQDVRDEYDPLYNPERYVEVTNASWLTLPEQDLEDEVITVFQFFLYNTARFDMTDLVLTATIKDGKGSEIGQVEIPVEGLIPGEKGTAVGTLQPEEDDEDGDRRLLTTHTFRELSQDDPDLQLRYSDGVEVAMDAAKFTAANIDILEIRAIPDERAAEAVSTNRVRDGG